MQICSRGQPSRLAAEGGGPGQSRDLRGTGRSAAVLPRGDSPRGGSPLGWKRARASELCGMLRRVPRSGCLLLHTRNVLQSLCQYHRGFRRTYRCLVPGRSRGQTSVEIAKADQFTGSAFACAGRVRALLLHAKRRIVQLSEILPLVGHVGFREDRRDRANGFARAAVDALLRMDEQLGLKLLFGNTGVWRDVRRFPAWDDGLVGPGSCGRIGDHVRTHLLHVFVDAVHRAYFHAGAVFHRDARFCDDVRHPTPPMPRTDSSYAPVLPPVNGSERLNRPSSKSAMVYWARREMLMAKTIETPSGPSRRFDVAGYEAIDPAVLETFPYEYPGKDISVDIDTDEFTAVCPWSGLPDFGTVKIRYLPQKRILELKSLKYYLFSYRNVGIFQEHAVVRILDDLAKVADPQWMEITLDYKVRVGLHTVCRARHPHLYGIVRRSPVTPRWLAS